MSKIIGIDLGTTNSAVAIIEGGQPKIIENQEGTRTTPSVVALAKNGDRMVGLLAKRQAVTNPDNTVYGIKRFIGRMFDDPEIQKERKLVSYKTEKSDNGGVLVKLGDQQLRPEEISAKILSKIKADVVSKDEKESSIRALLNFGHSFGHALEAIAGFDEKKLLHGEAVSIGMLIAAKLSENLGFISQMFLMK